MSTPTLSASEFATVTGMTRDRLRTWERRFGWPHPERAGGGARRYRTEDAARVVAVRRLHEIGVPLDRAIDQRSDPRTGSVGASTWRNLIDELPFGVVLLSGPVPLTVEFANAVLRARPDGPRAADILEDVAPWFSGEDAEELTSLFATDAPVTRVTHPDWTAGLARPAQSLAVQVRQTARSRPLVALIGLDAGGARRSQAERARLRHERGRLHGQDDTHRAWATTTRDVAVATAAPGLRGLRTGLQALRHRLDAEDAAVYVVDDGVPELVVSLSDGFAEIDPAGQPSDVQLGAVSRAVWLPPQSAGGIGAPEGTGLLLAGGPSGARRRVAVGLALRTAPELTPAGRELFESCAHLVARAVP